MAVRLLLIRHAAHSDVGCKLTGRGEERGLTAAGRSQASALAELLSHQNVAAVYSSPRLRTRQTAEAIAANRGLPVRIEDALDEIDFGEWTGMSFADLSGDPAWDQWNTARATARCPGGESMAEAVDRAGALLDDLQRRHDGEQVVLVTHCDIIRGLLCRIEGRSLDDILSFDAEPASVTRVEFGDRKMAAA